MIKNKVIKITTVCLIGLLIVGGGFWINKFYNKSNIVSVDNSYASYGLSEPQRYITKHMSTINGQKVNYTATAGETYIYNLKGEPTASIFSYSYIKDKGDNRPIIFAFNGGPGSSSLWLQMGIGPYKTELSSAVNPDIKPPYKYTENKNSILDTADIVFIDPVGTGYSKAVGVGKNEEFYGAYADADSMAQFIEQWVAKNNRWNSSKYILGESYGCKRAALLPNALMGGPTTSLGRFTGINIDGVIMTGATLDDDLTDKVMMKAMALPSMANTAWYHKKSGNSNQSIEEFNEEVMNFAGNEYYKALMKEGNGTLTDKEKQETIEKLIEYTGLPEKYFEKTLEIRSSSFSNELLKEENKDVGIYDGRCTLPNVGKGYEPVADDPAMGQYSPAFIATFHDYQKNVLNVDIDKPYNNIVWGDLNFKWDNSKKGLIPSKGYAYDLAAAMRRNQNMKLFVASGYYDLATPAGIVKNIINNAPIDKERVTFKEYESGHMVCLGESADKFINDLRELIK